MERAGHQSPKLTSLGSCAAVSSMIFVGTVSAYSDAKQSGLYLFVSLGNHQLFKRVRQRAPLCAQGQVNTIHHLDCVGHAWCLVAARSTPGRYTDVNLLHMSLKVCRLEVGTWWRHLHIVSCLSAFLALVPGLPAGLPACCVDCVVTARAVVPLIVFCTAFGPATAAFGPWPWTMKNEMLRCP